MSAKALFTFIGGHLYRRTQRLTATPLRGICPGENGFYETTEADAALSLAPDHKVRGWHLLSFFVNTEAPLSLRVVFIQRLGIKDHADFVLLKLNPGRFARLLRASPPTTSVELHVTHPSGPFRISDICIREMDIFLFGGLVIRTPLHAWQIVRLVYKYGFSNTCARIRAPFLEEFSQNYQKWTERYDTLTPERRKAIARLYDRENTRSVSIIANIGPGMSSAVNRLIQASSDQIHTRWELCMVGTSEALTEARANASVDTGSIRWIVAMAEDSVAMQLNKALAEAQGDYVIFVGGGYEPRPHALTMMAEAMRSGADIAYADEDRIDANGLRTQPQFKTGWNPDLLLSRDYISSAIMLRSEQARSLGGFRENFEGAEVYDLLLRLSAEIRGARIAHLPHVLFHRTGAEQTGLSAGESARRAVDEHLRARGVAAHVTTQSDGGRRVRYSLRAPDTLVSIIIPTRDRGTLLENCVRSVLEKTCGISYEIIIVDHDSREQEALQFLERCALDPRIKVVKYSGVFNYSRINNEAAKEARGQILVLLNNDTEVISPEWLVEMASLALRPEIGAVGAKLVFSSGHIQHSGVVSSALFGIDHVGRGMGRDEPGYMGRASFMQNYMAVTGACLALRREVFEEVGGLDTSLAVTFNDVDLCLRIGKKGYRIIWTPYAELFHLESATRGPNEREVNRSFRMVRRRWPENLENDIYCSPNLTPVHSAPFPNMPLSSNDFVLASPPTVPRPWTTPVPFASLTTIDNF